MAANLQFAESLRQSIQRCKLDLLGRVDTGNGIQRISNFFRRARSCCICIGYQIQSSWREFFDRPKISTSKRDGCKVPAKDSCQNNSPPEYKAKTCQSMAWGFLNGHAARGVLMHFKRPYATYQLRSMI